MKHFLALISFLSFLVPSSFAAPSYFLSTLADFGATEPGFMMMVIGGSQLEDFTPGTLGDQCGNYDQDGLGSYAPSAIFTGTLTAKRAFWIEKNGQKVSRVVFDAWLTTASSPGAIHDETARFKEDPDDDGACVQGGTAYYKYLGEYTPGK
jgi:hypothetical protein